MNEQRKRWRLRCRDLLSRQQWITLQVDPLTGGVDLHVPRETARLDHREVARLRDHLAAAQASAIGAYGWADEERRPL